MDTKFVWSNLEFTLQELISVHPFPIIIKVSGGYLGDTANESISANEILWLHSHDQHNRVIARDPSGKRVYSIPVSYPEPFLLEGQKKPKLLKDIYTSTQKPYKIHPPESAFKSRSDPHKVFQLKELNVEDEYQETFIKTNAIREGCLDSNVSVIPCYVKAKVVVAEGLQGCLPGQWTQYIQDIQKLAQEFDYSAVQPDKQEIMLYSAKMVADAENIYATVEPSHYISIERKDQSDVDYHQYTGLAQGTTPQHNPSEDVYDEVQDGEKQVMIDDRKMNNGKKKSLRGFGRLFSKRNISMDQEVVEGDSTSIKDGSHKGAPGESASKEKNKSSKKSVARRTSKDHSHKEEKVVNDLVKELANRQESQKPAVLPKPKKKVGKFSTLGEVPVDLTSLSADEVSDCLRLLSLESYVGLFQENLVDGMLLCEITGEMLKKDFKMKGFEAMKLSKFIEGWRAK